MKIKLDENVPAGLKDVRTELSHEVDTTPEEGLQGQGDSQVWAAAQQAGALLITQDLDFSDVRRYRPGTHHGLLLLRLREPGRVALISRVRDLFAREDIRTWSGCFIVATERKVRVRRPEA